MCIICIELEKDKLTASEAFRNFWEMKDSIEEEHIEEVTEAILAAFHEELGEEQ